MDTPEHSSLQPRCRECAEDLAGVVRSGGIAGWLLDELEGVLGG